ncbi:MAG: co-chaperone GroES [Alteromonadales bacterium]|nr:co-chaperone GroES [Alteromonadales bacterium]
MKAVGNYLLIKQKEKGTTKTDGGLLLAEKNRKDIRYVEAEIYDAGEHESILNKGDKIFYDRVAGHKIEHNSEEYHVIKMQDIVVVL